MSVHMEAGWTLKRLADEKVVWRDSILSNYTAGTDDALGALDRLRVATEAAARRNIA